MSRASGCVGAFVVLLVLAQAHGLQLKGDASEPQSEEGVTRPMEKVDAATEKKQPEQDPLQQKIIRLIEVRGGGHLSAGT